MNADIQIPASSRQYVKVPITAEVSGSSYDPTGDQVDLAFVTVGAQPGDSDWVTGSWEIIAAIPYARVLIGPGGQKVLGGGFYDVYVRVTDDPERPVIGPRQIEIVGGGPNSGGGGDTSGLPDTAGHDGNSLEVVNGAAAWVAGSIFVLSRHAILFTESQGDGTYVGSVVLPPGTSILDVAVFCLAGPWKKISARLTIGDEGLPQGYMHNIDLVGQLIDPYDNTAPATTSQWTNPNIAGGAYGQSATLYSAGNAVYTPTVRYPDGGRITATVVAVQGGPIVSSRVNASDKGSGYAPGDTGTIIQAPGSGATYRVDTVDGSGAVLTYTITDPGSGYVLGDDNSTTTSGGGDGFFAVDITEVGADPVTAPGVVVVDVIGFGVPVGSQNAVKA